MVTTTNNSNLTIKNFIIISLLVSLWINASEVFRYFILVRPEMQSSLAIVPSVASMDLAIFFIWGVWDTVLTMLTVFNYYLFSEKFGRNKSVIILSGTFAWSFFFLLFWIAMPNMGLARWAFIIIPLSLAWAELLIATFITDWLFRKFSI